MQLWCPSCNTRLKSICADWQKNRIDHETGKIGNWFPFYGYKTLECPCCNWFCNIESYANILSWEELEIRAINKGALNKPDPEL